MWPNYCEHTPMLSVGSVPPSQQHNRTSEPKKMFHHRPLVSGQKLGTEETSKQKKLKQTQGTTLEVTGAIDQNPVVSTDYTGRGL